MKSLVSWAGCLTLLLAANPGAAHYHILLPDNPSVERETAVKFTLRFGHPFEHQMFQTAKPRSVTVIITPVGASVDLSAKIDRYDVPGVDGKAASGYAWTYSPAHRGDQVVFVRCEPQWMPEEKEFLEDSVKVILHVQTQNGWDAAAGDGMELVPLTRPYGLRAGTVFQVVVRDKTDGNQSLAGILVEVERYNPAPPKKLPPDEQITRTVKTDPNGVATATLPEAGWWAITAVRPGGTRMHDGKAYPVKVRSTLWVPVDEAK